MAEDGATNEKQEYQLKEPHTYKIITSYMSESFELDAINTALIAVDKHKHLKGVRAAACGPAARLDMCVCVCVRGRRHVVGQGPLQASSVRGQAQWVSALRV